MPYLTDKATERVPLVSNPDYWVEISTDLTWSDMKAVSNVDNEGSVTYKVDSILAVALVQWNLDDAAGNPLPLTPENIDKLRRPDIEKIISVLGGKIEEPVSEKKSS